MRSGCDDIISGNIEFRITWGGEIGERWLYSRIKIYESRADFLQKIVLKTKKNATISRFKKLDVYFIHKF